MCGYPEFLKNAYLIKFGPCTVLWLNSFSSQKVPYSKLFQLRVPPFYIFFYEFYMYSHAWGMGFNPFLIQEIFKMTGLFQGGGNPWLIFHFCKSLFTIFF